MKGLELMTQVLPTHGVFCISGFRRDKSLPPRERFFAQYSEDTAAYIEELETEERDVYYAAATFQDPDERRVVRNIHSLKAFFYDIDCNKGNGTYGSKQEAIADLLRFMDETKLPKPTLVDSGNGVQAYWILTDPIEYNEWEPIAEAFKRLARDHGLKIDPVVTADGARLLRLPGTKNQRYPEKMRFAKVKNIQPPVELDAFVSYIGYIPRGAYSPQGPDSLMTKLLNNSTKYKFSRIYKKSIQMIEVEEEVEEEHTLPDGTKHLRLVKKKVQRSAGCPQIAYCVANRERLEEPMWNAALSIAWFCVDKIEGIAAVSKGYPDTTPDDWYDKASKRTAPYNCESWRGLDHPHLCGQCIHRTKIKNPISLGVVIEQATPEDNVMEVKHAALGETVTVELPNEYPWPWIRPKTGGVALKGDPSAAERNEDDESDPDEVLVYQHDFWVKRRMKEKDKEIIVMARVLPHDGLLEFSAPLADVVKIDKLQAILAERGITAAANPGRLKLLRAYVAAWVNKLQLSSGADVTRVQFGWQDDDSVFVIGGREIGSDGLVRYSPTKKAITSIADIYTKKGSLDEWRKVANYYAKPSNVARAFALFCSFGSPLYRFVGEGSLIVHLTNASSGVGKSTAQKMGLSVWGDPVRSLMTDADTANAKLNRAGVVKNMFIAWDEMTNIAPEVASHLFFDVSSGRGKNRLRGGDNEERENTATWEAIFMTSGNNSMHDTLKQHREQVEGELYRVLDVPITADMTMTKAEADEAYARILPHNYGHAGEEFMRYVVPHKDVVIKRLHEMQVYFDKLTEANSKERFYSAGFAAAFTGAEIANQLGLITIPIQPVMDWAIALLGDTRRAIKKATPVTDTSNYAETISRYWNEHIHQILVVQNGREEVDERLLNQQSLKPVIGALKGRYEVSSKRLYLAASDFNEWLRDKRMPTTQVLLRMKDAGVLEKEEQFNLGYDTSAYSTASVLTYRFNAAKLTKPA